MRVISSNTTSASEGGIPTSVRENERRRGVNRSVLVFLYVLDTTLPTSPRSTKECLRFNLCTSQRKDVHCKAAAQADLRS